MFKRIMATAFTLSLLGATTGALAQPVHPVGGGGSPHPGGSHGGQHGGPGGGGVHPGGGGGYHPGPGGGFNPGGGGGGGFHPGPSGFPRVVHPSHQFHWHGSWAPPPGYYDHHWGYGERLPWGWYTQSYWIGDYDSYDLASPPPGYEWIRVGSDAVLVDLNDGMVVQTVYGVFY